MSNTSITQSRKYGLDFLKGIAACFVVFMHVRFPEPTGRYVALLGTFAVPVFFMTSGYFGYGASRAKTMRSIKRTATYLLVAYVIGIINLLITHQFNLHDLWQFFGEKIFTKYHLIHFVLFTDARVSGVAWFLISLLICYALKYLLGDKFRYIAYAALLLRVLGSLQYPFLRITVPVNTPWVTGIPFFFIGELFRVHEGWVNQRIKSSHLVLQAAVGLAILASAIVYRSLFWYIGILLLSPALFVLFSRSDMKYNKMCLLGSVYAFFIYIMHPLVMHVYDALRPSLLPVEAWLRPLIVLLVTIMMAWAYYTTKHTLVKKQTP